ncbi:conserved Plasmodium protein, unknown function [Plasmodium yoelii]|uniref:Uncharacterized protein n=2 Tax=Plasmodium yoelii TaxID=5861 RepID=A0AAE9WNP1_PLAYO|nr:conserved Plasmodium protein, unknown function [Plasmodium yoelii]WBY57115.1 hypothetical protein Py17XNL_000900066 [Plasmodium yoelii yoelii]CDU17812.1 conserved Plasmodium protein, unknown function, fragment [Plasmodium yoelii]VTZ78229.1 conserved Plasmodium protein, unknown function [Plasmodium yoelii]|eukprot:XP_731016.2 conserved Plasmodium protein, unknown function [Plasmodium yoelii]
MDVVKDEYNTQNSMPMCKKEKSKKIKTKQFFSGFDDFKINYTFSTKNICSDKKNKGPLYSDTKNSITDDCDMIKLIKIINTNYIDKKFYFKKLSRNDLYKIFVYSNLLTRSLILYPSLIHHFENIIENFKKIKTEQNIQQLDEHIMISYTSTTGKEYNQFNKYSNNQNNNILNLVKNENSQNDLNNIPHISDFQKMTSLYIHEKTTNHISKEKIKLEEQITNTIHNNYEQVINTRIMNRESEQIINPISMNQFNNSNNYYANCMGNNTNVMDEGKEASALKSDQFCNHEYSNSTVKHNNNTNGNNENADNKQQTLQTSNININHQYPTNNICTKNINNEYKCNTINLLNPNIPNAINFSLNKNVRVYKNINEYDIIELKISTSFNNKNICRYIGIHSGMTLYNIHRCICICLGIKKEDTDNYLHVFVLNNGNIYGSGKKCSVSIIRKIQINTDRHITFKHIVKTPLYLYKSKDENQTNQNYEYPTNNINLFDENVFPNNEYNYNNLNNFNDINRTPRYNINMASPILNNLNYADIKKNNIDDEMFKTPRINSINFSNDSNLNHFEYFKHKNDFQSFKEDNIKSEIQIPTNKNNTQDIRNMTDINNTDNNNFNANIATNLSHNPIENIKPMQNTQNKYPTNCSDTITNIKFNENNIMNNTNFFRQININDLYSDQIYKNKNNNINGDIIDGDSFTPCNTNCNKYYNLRSNNTNNNSQNNDKTIQNFNQYESDLNFTQQNNNKIYRDNNSINNYENENNNFSHLETKQIENTNALNAFHNNTPRKNIDNNEEDKTENNHINSEENTENISITLNDSLTSSNNNSIYERTISNTPEVSEYFSSNNKNGTSHKKNDVLNNCEHGDNTGAISNNSYTINGISNSINNYKNVYPYTCSIKNNNTHDTESNNINNYILDNIDENHLKKENNQKNLNDIKINNKNNFINRNINSDHLYSVNPSNSFTNNMNYNIYNIDSKIENFNSDQIHKHCSDRNNNSEIYNNCINKKNSNNFINKNTSISNYTHNIELDINNINMNNFSPYKKDNQIIQLNNYSKYEYNNFINNIKNNNIPYENTINNNFNDSPIDIINNNHLYNISINSNQNVNNSILTDGHINNYLINDSIINQNNKCIQQISNNPTIIDIHSFDTQHITHYPHLQYRNYNTNNNFISEKNISNISQNKNNQFYDSSTSQYNEQNSDPSSCLSQYYQNCTPPSNSTFSHPSNNFYDVTQSTIEHVETVEKDQNESFRNETNDNKNQTIEVNRRIHTDSQNKDNLIINVDKINNTTKNYFSELENINANQNMKLINNEDTIKDPELIQENDSKLNITFMEPTNVKKNKDDLSGAISQCVQEDEMPNLNNQIKDDVNNDNTIDNNNNSDNNNNIDNNNSDNNNDNASISPKCKENHVSNKRPDEQNCQDDEKKSQKNIPSITQSNEIIKINNNNKYSFHIDNKIDGINNTMETNKHKISNIIDNFSQTHQISNHINTHLNREQIKVDENKTEEINDINENIIYKFNQIEKTQTCDNNTQILKEKKNINTLNLVQEKTNNQNFCSSVDDIKLEKDEKINLVNKQNEEENESNIIYENEQCNAKIKNKDNNKIENKPDEKYIQYVLNNNHSINSPNFNNSNSSYHKFNLSNNIHLLQNQDTKELEFDNQNECEKKVYINEEKLISSQNDDNNNNDPSHFKFLNFYDNCNNKNKLIDTTNMNGTNYYIHENKINKENKQNEYVQIYNNENFYSYNKLNNDDKKITQPSIIQFDEKINNQNLYQNYCKFNQLPGILQNDNNQVSFDLKSRYNLNNIIINNRNDFTSNIDNGNLPQTVSHNNQIHMQYEKETNNTNNNSHSHINTYRINYESPLKYLNVDGQNDPNNLYTTNHVMAMNTTIDSCEYPLNRIYNNNIDTQKKTYYSPNINFIEHNKENYQLRYNTNNPDRIENHPNTTEHNICDNEKNTDNFSPYNNNNQTDQIDPDIISPENPVSTSNNPSINNTYYNDATSPTPYPNQSPSISFNEKELSNTPTQDLINQRNCQYNQFNDIYNIGQKDIYLSSIKGDPNINNYHRDNTYIYNNSLYPINNNDKYYLGNCTDKNNKTNDSLSDNYFYNSNMGIYLNTNNKDITKSETIDKNNFIKIRPEKYDGYENGYIKNFTKDTKVDELDIKDMNDDDNITISECINSENEINSNINQFEENKSSFSMLYLFGKVKFYISIIDIIHNKTNSHDLLWVPRCCNGSYGSFLKNNYLNTNEINKYVPEDTIDIDCINLKLMETRFSKNVASSRTTKRKRMIDIDKTVLHFYKEHISEFFNNKSKIIKLTKKLCKYKKKRKYNTRENNENTEYQPTHYSKKKNTNIQVQKTNYKRKKITSQQTEKKKNDKIGEENTDNSTEIPQDTINSIDHNASNEFDNINVGLEQNNNNYYTNYYCNYYNNERVNNNLIENMSKHVQGNDILNINLTNYNDLTNKNTTSKRTNDNIINKDIPQGNLFDPQHIKNSIYIDHTNKNDILDNFCSEQINKNYNDSDCGQFLMNPKINTQDKLPTNYLTPTEVHENYYNSPTDINNHSNYSNNNNSPNFKNKKKKKKNDVKPQINYFNENNTNPSLNISKLLEANNNFINISNIL